MEEVGNVFFFRVLPDPGGVGQEAESRKVGWGVDSQGHGVTDGLMETLNFVVITLNKVTSSSPLCSTRQVYQTNRIESYRKRILKC